MVDEPDILPFLLLRQKLGVQILLPVVLDYSRRPGTGADRLGVAELGKVSDLQRNRWGIMEPVGPLLSAAAADLILVPALGVDSAGTRIGHGFGYYDELLSRLTAPSVCPIFKVQLLERIPAEDHDRPVSGVVTPDRVIRTAPHA
jgi:5-formyltetrahydrofolate cyclo-ligase